MRFRKGFTMRMIGTDYVIVPEGVETINFNKLMNLKMRNLSLQKMN